MRLVLPVRHRLYRVVKYTILTCLVLEVFGMVMPDQLTHDYQDPPGDFDEKMWPRSITSRIQYYLAHHKWPPQPLTTMF